MISSTKKSYKPRCKYPLDLMELDYVRAGLSQADLMRKYNIPVSSATHISNLCKRFHWKQKRQEYLSIRDKLSGTNGLEDSRDASPPEAIDRFRLVQNMERLVNLKIEAEIQAVLDGRKRYVDLPKDIMRILNLSKDSASELMKTVELLKGNPTSRVSTSSEQRRDRIRRLREVIVDGKSTLVEDVADRS